MKPENPYNWRLVVWMALTMNPVSMLIAGVIDAVQDFLIPCCKRPPSGWYCTREPGHSGPCAARYRP